MTDPLSGDTLPQPSSRPGAFELLHTGVQRQLWQMRWTQLRPLQIDAIRHIIHTSDDAILSAATASGKTEAAFLPILSILADEPRQSVQAMYVGPLKALINDQFGRIEELCEHLDVPVHRWHGDVSDSKKAKLIKEPGGVLLITPESLESLFVNRSHALRALFGGLRFVVIDELHSFLANERGLHLRSLLSRLRRITAGATFRCIGLSATIGDTTVAQRYLAPEQPQNVTIISDTGSYKETKFRIHGYRELPAPETDTDDEQEDDSADPLEDTMRIAADVVRHCAGRSNLVFANRKMDVEEFADASGRIGQSRGLRDVFLVHHGSLSAEIRQDAEATMKDGTVATTFCSSTLEMGIDLGSVEAVGQIGPPWSVSSLKQRIGRSGRRDGEPQVMRVYCLCHRPDPRSSLFDRLHLNLVQAIAVTELMLDGWVEPPALPTCDLSTLTQQVISVITQFGGVRADVLYDALCIDGPFRDIERALFIALLRNLAVRDVVEQTTEGDLILGLMGERLRKDKGFYAVFKTPEEFTVLYEGQVLGKLESAYDVGDHLLFAGRRWQIVGVDEALLEIHVVPARGKKPPRFGGGIGEIHPRVRQQMRDVLMSADTYGYLDREGQDLLSEAREAARSAGIFRSALFAIGPKKSALFTWTGTRIHETLLAAFASLGVTPGDEDVALTFDRDVEWLRKSTTDMTRETWHPEELARFVAERKRRKYDWLLDDRLLDVSIARGVLDVDGASLLLRSL